MDANNAFLQGKYGFCHNSSIVISLFIGYNTYNKIGQRWGLLKHNNSRLKGVVLQIIYTRTAIKVINALDKTTKQRIKKGILGLIEIPRIGDIKQMKGLETPTYRLRVGKYRVLYEYININGKQAIAIKDVGSRGDIYK